MRNTGSRCAGFGSCGTWAQGLSCPSAGGTIPNPRPLNWQAGSPGTTRFAWTTTDVLTYFSVSLLSCHSSPAFHPFKVCSAFSIIKGLCNNLILEHCHPLRGNSFAIISDSFSPSLAPGNHWSTFCVCGSASRSVLCKWDSARCGLCDRSLSLSTVSSTELIFLGDGLAACVWL